MGVVVYTYYRDLCDREGNVTSSIERDFKSSIVGRHVNKDGSLPIDLATKFINNWNALNFRIDGCLLKYRLCNMVNKKDS